MSNSMSLEVVSSHSLEWNKVISLMNSRSIYHCSEYYQISQRMIDARAYLFHYQNGPYRIAIPLLIRPCSERRTASSCQHNEATSAYGYPGPLASHEDLPPAIIAEFQTSLKTAFAEQNIRKATSRINPFSETSSLFEGFGSVRQVGSTVLIKLDSEHEQRFRSYRRNHRKDITKMRRSNLKTFVDRDFENIDTFVEQYYCSMNKAAADKKYMFGRDYFSDLVTRLRNKLFLLVCQSDENVICSGLFFCSGEIAYAHLVGSNPTETFRSPIKLLFDDACQFFAEKGCKALYLGGGVQTRNDDLFHFKRGFSDVIVPFSVWEWNDAGAQLEALTDPVTRVNAHGTTTSNDSPGEEHNAMMS